MNDPTPTLRAGAHRPRAAAPSVIYAAAAATFTAFAIWGSFFPFTFRPADPGAALASFWAAWLGGPLTWSLSDFVSNILLFIPIGLFGAAAIDGRPAGRGHWLPWSLAFCGGVLLSLTIEAGQALVPWRTSSVVDVLAEACGTAIGIGCAIARNSA